MARRRRRSTKRRVQHRRRTHRNAKYAVKCGKRVRSYHRKKSAANKKRPSGCRVVKAR